MILKKLENLVDNPLIAVAGVFGMVLGPLADATGKSVWYWILLGVLLLLVLFAVFDEIHRYDTLHRDVLHLPLVIRVDDKTDSKYVLTLLLQRIEEQLGVKNYAKELLKYRKLNVEEFVFDYNGSIYDFNRLLSFAQLVSYRVNQSERELKTKIRFHIAYYRRPSVAFMLGVIFRTEGVVLYQNNDAAESFERVADIADRRYKERLEALQRYELEEDFQEEAGSEVLVVINSASHNVDLRAQGVSHYQNRVVLTLKPRNGKKGTIPYKEEWSEYAAEIYTVLHDMRLRFDKIILAHAMPEALAFIVGMAIENYWNIDITQYEVDGYKRVYNMQDVKYYF